MVPEIDFWAPEVSGHVLLYVPPSFQPYSWNNKGRKRPLRCSGPTISSTITMFIVKPHPWFSCCSPFGTSRDQGKPWIPFSPHSGCSLKASRPVQRSCYRAGGGKDLTWPEIHEFLKCRKVERTLPAQSWNGWAKSHFAGSKVKLDRIFGSSPSDFSSSVESYIQL